MRSYWTLLLAVQRLPQSPAMQPWHQIHDGTDRDALHVARVLAMSLEAAR